MRDYAPGSQERKSLQAALKNMRSELTKAGPFSVSSVVGGAKIETNDVATQAIPFQHAQKLCSYHKADRDTIAKAIKGALEVKPHWESMPFHERANIFLKAADLLSTKYRYKLLAATMLGQGKNAWQAEIDAAAELADFWRFNCKFAAGEFEEATKGVFVFACIADMRYSTLHLHVLLSEIYAQQPPRNAKFNWNRLEYRPLEGFVTAISPFNFTAIGGNLCSAPALMGNVVLWKPSDSAIYSNYLIMEILKEAGLPDGVIQFLPSSPDVFVKETFSHPEFAGLHFTGSTSVFKKLWQDISNNLDTYHGYPRIVGETGGKNMHFLHKSADVESAVHNTIRAAFEYQGQKCSACSRVYVPDNLWEDFKTLLVSEVKKLKQGPVDDFENFTSAVINKPAYDRLAGVLKDVANDKTTQVLVGGTASDKEGYYISPTVLVTTDPQARTMREELFGPVVTVYVYPADKFEETLDLAAKSKYALTGALFARDREALLFGSTKLRHAAGNFYINDKSTGAVVGQQPFGGARGSGTNDKAGSAL
ncbi:1-pyrroline-5-carboxylate dehydrogenase [Quaeritorhiza haematococci]|nr:1-pyrroline-5-carboxylate dehydrogenase [Quaeritorhiza haematococci]